MRWLTFYTQNWISFVIGQALKNKQTTKNKNKKTSFYLCSLGENMLMNWLKNSGPTFPGRFCCYQRKPGLPFPKVYFVYPWIWNGRVVSAVTAGCIYKDNWRILEALFQNGADEQNIIPASAWRPIPKNWGYGCWMGLTLHLKVLSK